MSATHNFQSRASASIFLTTRQRREVILLAHGARDFYFILAGETEKVLLRNNSQKMVRYVTHNFAFCDSSLNEMFQNKAKQMKTLQHLTRVETIGIGNSHVKICVPSTSVFLEIFFWSAT